MALALYRKYRPASFSEVRGQDHVTEPLMQALTNDRLHHAYLFSGPRGCGKTSSARILARSLNCEQGPTPNPCGVCASCVGLAPDGPGSLDVIEIDAATHGLVDDARELRERAHFAPVSSRNKIYIIDEAHMLGPGAANALLKVIEEPPEFVTFVLATTEPDKLIVTIRSRTHHYPFRLVPPSTMRGLLEEICEKENATVEPTVLPLVVRAGGGSVRDSLSILDQLLAGAGEGGVSYSHALGLLGVTDTALIDEVVDALSAGDGASMFGVVERVVEAGHDPRRFAGDLLERLRDLIILDAVPDAAATSLIEGPEDQLERMVGQASRLAGGTLSRLADIVHDGLTEMRGTTSPRLLLELICARMLLPAADDSTSGLVQRIERLERRAELGGAASPVAGSTVETTTPVAVPAKGSTSDTVAVPPVAVPPVAVPPVAVPPVAVPPVAVEDDAAAPVPAARDSDAQPGPEPEPQSEAPAAQPPAPAAPAAPKATGAAPVSPASGQWDVAGIRRVWPDVVAAAKSRKQTVGAYLLDATVSAFDGTTLTLSFPHAFHAKSLQSEPSAGIFDQALDQVLGVRWKIQCEVAGADVGGARASVTNAADASSSGGGPVADSGQNATPEAQDPAKTTATDQRIDLEDEPEAEPDNDSSAGSSQAPDQAHSAEDAAIELLGRSLGAREITDHGRA